MSRLLRTLDRVAALVAILCSRFRVRSADLSAANTAFANAGKQDFIPPGNNARRDGDWLLVLEPK
jgi:hypothetical protein